MSKSIKSCLGSLVAAVLLASGAGPAFAVADPSSVSFTLEGCRNNGTITLPNGDGKFICPDAAYTTGNLGKGWNELDLVPHRITAKAGNSAPATQTYAVAISADNCDGATGFPYLCADSSTRRPGYDVMSAPVLNAALSSAGCPAMSASAQTTLAPGVGGTAVSIARILTINNQAKNTTCVYDYYERLALGSHLYPGASLHSNLLNQAFGTQGIGAKDVSIPVKEILPQELRKDMSATADSTVLWNLLKSADTPSVNFGNVCEKPGTKQSKQVTFRVEWVKTGTTGGGVNFITNIYAKNPSARTITVNVTDKVYKGTTQVDLLDTKISGDVDVNANTEKLVLTHSGTLPSTAGAIGDSLNDVATASYTDKVTGVAVPGTTEARATATIGAGVVENSSVAIADSESMTGTGLKFSVATPAIGAFVGTPAYVAGAETVGPVDWAISGETTGRYVDFVKTIYLDTSRVTSGTLTDTAVLTATIGDFTKTAGPVEVGITSSASVKLTVQKTIPPIVMAAGQQIEVTFRITRNGDATYEVDKTLVFSSLETVKSVTVEGLTPDMYTVTELSSLFYDGTTYGPSNLVIQGSNQTVLNLTAGDDGIFQAEECAKTAEFVNIPKGGSAVAQVQKITDPTIADDPNDPNYADIEWTFTLAGPGGPKAKTVKAGAGYGEFELVLEEGNYTVTETQKTPAWVLTSAAPDANGDKVCEFTVDYPADFGRTFSCTFYNQKQGKAKVVKTVSGQVPSGTQAFAFSLREGASTTQNGTTLASATANAGNLGVINFAPDLKPGNTYQMCEDVMPGWNTNLGTYGTLFVPGSFLTPTLPNPEVNNMTVCVNFTVAAGETKTFSVDNTPPPGGFARTIGFWKNWSSCDGKGGQKPVLDQTMALAETAGVVVSSNYGAWPYFGTTFYLVLHGSTATPNAAPDCVKAIRLLNKSRIDTGKKMASDPAFNLAAQLLAAELNQYAGAGTNATVLTAITNAVRALGAVQFNGSTHTHINAAAATNMNNLAKTLDDYNNNR